MNDEILQGYSISDYLAATENKGWNPDTRRYYTNCLHDLLAFTVQHGVPTPKTMAEWEQSLEQVYTRSAVNVHLAAANNYFKWCGRYDLLRGHTRVTEEQERSPTLTRTEYLKLLRTARSLGKHRIYLLIKLFATTGVPIQCLNQVTAELVKQGSGTLKYRDGAFGFRCPPALQQELLAYMAENGIYRGPVFITRTGHAQPAQPVQGNTAAGGRPACSPAPADVRPDAGNGAGGHRLAAERHGGARCIAQSGKLQNILLAEAMLRQLFLEQDIEIIRCQRQRGGCRLFILSEPTILEETKGGIL